MTNDLLYLACCAIHRRVPDTERVAAMDMDRLMQLSRRHQITAMTAMALEPVFEMPGEAWQQWKQYKEKAVRKCVLLDAERAKHLSFFESEGIWYIPLKGILLKDFYPQYGMREMADNDILFDPAFRENVRDYMISQGYEVRAFGGGVHDSYVKEPVYNFEYHVNLFVKRLLDGNLSDYFADVKSRAVKDDNNRYGYHLSDTDLYVHVTAHAFKHYDAGGTGLRTLTDNYVFRHAKDLQFDVIDSVLEKLGLLDFDITLRSLSEKLFADPEGKPELSEKEDQMLRYMTGSGIYGTITNSVSNRISKFGNARFKKLRYVCSRIFLPLDTVEASFPLFSKYKILLPFLPIYRLARGINKNRAHMKSEIKALRDHTSN